MFGKGPVLTAITAYAFRDFSLADMARNGFCLFDFGIVILLFFV